jgi:hypothetical protein
LTAPGPPCSTTTGCSAGYRISRNRFRAAFGGHPSGGEGLEFR